MTEVSNISTLEERENDRIGILMNELQKVQKKEEQIKDELRSLIYKIKKLT